MLVAPLARAAGEPGITFWVDETRPWLQGGRTASSFLVVLRELRLPLRASRSEVLSRPQTPPSQAQNKPDQNVINAHRRAALLTTRSGCELLVA